MFVIKKSSVVVALMLCISCMSARADLESARDLMEAGDFKAAMTQLQPAARSGNAESSASV